MTVRLHSHDGSQLVVKAKPAYQVQGSARQCQVQAYQVQVEDQSYRLTVWRTRYEFTSCVELVAAA